MTAAILNEERLIRKLRIIPERVRGAIQHAMADQADEIVDMMRRLVPVEPGKPDLRDSIMWHWGSRGGGAGRRKVAKIKSAQQEDLTITIVAADNLTFYGKFIEFGTQKMEPRPFFFVSWRANRKGAKGKISAAVRKAARQVAAGG